MTDTMTRRDAFRVLGQPCLSTKQAKEALDRGGLSGWDVRKTPAFTVDEKTGQTIQMPGRSAVVYDRPEGGLGYLGDVGSVHTVMQNEQQIEFLNILRDELGATFETAGLAAKGRHVFVTMKLPGRALVGGVDRVDNYVTSINAHDGSKRHTVMVLPNRFACMNMLPLAMKNHSHMIQVRHTRGAEVFLKIQIRELSSRLFGYLDEFYGVADRLVQTPLTQARFERIIDREYGPDEDASPAAITRAEERTEKMSQLFADAATQEGIRETAWAGLNAITEYFDHFAPVRPGPGGDAAVVRADRAIRPTAFKARALDLMLGAGK